MRFALALALAVSAAACAPRVAEDRATLTPAAFADLPGWSADDPRAALDALARSCERRVPRPPGRAVGPFALAGFEKDWAAPCAALAGLDRTVLDAPTARAFIERHFRPFALSGPDGDEGLFTGYYEAAARGSRTRTARYNVPLYRRPPDLVEADLGVFSEEFRGRTIAGRVKDGRLVPYDDRRRIARGTLAGQGLELLWLDDPVDGFFLEIQGSGRIKLDDGSVVRVGFAA